MIKLNKLLSLILIICVVCTYVGCADNNSVYLDLSETKTNYSVGDTSNIKIYYVENDTRTDISHSGTFEYELDSSAFSVTADGVIKAESIGVSLLKVKYTNEDETVTASVALYCTEEIAFSSDTDVYVHDTDNPAGADGVKVTYNDKNRNFAFDETAAFMSFWFYDVGNTKNKSYFAVYDSDDKYAILTTDSSDYYKYNLGGSSGVSNMKRTVGWHQCVITVSNANSWRMFVDGDKIFEKDYASGVVKFRLYKEAYYYDVRGGKSVLDYSSLEIINDPYNGQLLEIDEILEYEFNDEIDENTVTDDSIYILDKNDKKVPSSKTTVSDKIKITPLVSLNYEETYKVVFTADVKGKEKICGQRLISSDIEKTVKTKKAPVKVKNVEDLSDSENYKFKITYINNETDEKNLSNVLVTYKNGVVMNTAVQKKNIITEDYIEIEAKKGDSDAVVLYYFKDFATDKTSVVNAPEWKNGSDSIVSPEINESVSDSLDINVDTNNDIINIKGFCGIATAKIPVFVYTMAEGKKISDIKNGDVSNVLSKFALVYTDEKGVYSLDEKMSATSENYDIYVYSDNAEIGNKLSVEAITSSERDGAVDGISKADENNIEERFEASKYFLKLDTSKFDNLTAKGFVYGCLLEKQPYSTESEIKTVYNDAVEFVYNLEKGGEDARKCLIANKSRFTNISDSVYKHLTEEMTDVQLKNAVAIMLKYENFKNLNENIDEAVVYSSLINAYNYQELRNIAEKFYDIIGISSKDLEDISSNVYKTVVKEKNEENYKTTEDFKKYILKYHEEEEDEDSKGGSSFTGGSSLIVSDKKPITVDETIKNEAMQKPVVNVKEDYVVFEDLIGCEWAKPAITELSKRNVVNGVDEKTFLPNEYVTREAFIKMVVLAFEITADEIDLPYSDVDKDAWYYDYVNTATAAGIVNGVSENKFGIGEFITREDAAVMMKRALDYRNVFFDDIITIRPFFDTEDISDYAKDSVALLRENLIINGTGGNYFMPKNTITRAQAAKMICEAVLSYEEDK